MESTAKHEYNEAERKRERDQIQLNTQGLAIEMDS